MRADLFIGRQEELERLNSLWGKNSASLVVVRGRRRIGKSRLIAEFAKSKRFLHFSGIPPTSQTHAQDQRDIFAQQIGRQLQLPGITATDWATLFSLLAKQTETGPVIILLDEISWMGSKDPLFLGQLKNAWDLEFKKNPQLILILCGSVSTWIEQNIINSTGFFGRISLFLKLEELPLEQCRELLHSKGFKQSAYEEFKILCIAGGIPWYLEQIQGKLNADDNIRNLCFRQEGALFNEFKHIFHDLFNKRSALYETIVSALAERSLDLTTLCANLDYPKSGTMSEYLEDLIQSGFVTRDHTWLIKSGKPSTLSQFRLSDNYLRFYLKYIQKNQDRIIKTGFIPGWNAILGLQFENLVLKNRKKIWSALGIKPEDITADNPYFQRKSSLKQGCQIDYLIQTRFNTLFACEIKFSAHPIESNVIEEVKTKIDRIGLPKRFSCWPVLIHINGVSESLENSGYFSHIVDLSS